MSDYSKEPTYGAAFYAKLFDISERRIQQLAKEGVIPKVGRGKYPLLSTVQGYVRFLQERSLSPEAAEGDINSNRNRLLREQADALAMKNAQVRRELVSLEFLVFVLARLSGDIKSIFDALPMDCMRELGAGVREAEKVRALTAHTADRIAHLADRQWIEAALNDYDAANSGGSGER